MWKGRRCKAAIMVMDEGDDAGWWLCPKEESVYGDCSCAHERVESATCVKEIIPLCTTTPDTTRALLSAVISSDESAKVREKHSAVMAWVQQWKVRVMQMLLCLETQQRVACRSTAGWSCYHRVNIRTVGAHKLRNNGSNCLVGKQTKDHLPRPGRVLSDCRGNKGCRMKGRARRVVGQPEEFKAVEKEWVQRLQCRPVWLAARSCSAQPPPLAE